MDIISYDENIFFSTCSPPQHPALPSMACCARHVSRIFRADPTGASPAHTVLPHVRTHTKALLACSARGQCRREEQPCYSTGRLTSRAFALAPTSLTRHKTRHLLRTTFNLWRKERSNPPLAQLAENTHPRAGERGRETRMGGG